MPPSACGPIAQERHLWCVSVRRHLIRLLVALSVIGSAVVPATALGGQEVASFCSPSGDFCTGVFVSDGRYWLNLKTTFSLREPYKLCGREQGYAFECLYFRLRAKSDGGYESRVDLRRHFGPELGRGLYAVRWRSRGLALGPTLHFHVG
jgi:hypothetical protein